MPLELKKGVILVEGEEEKLILNKLISYLDFTNITVSAIPSKQKEIIDERIAGLKEDNWFKYENKVLGIILDSDDNPTGHEQRIKHFLGVHEFPVPNKPLELAGDETLKTIFLTIASNEDYGMVETIFDKIATGLPEYNCVNRYFECLKNHNIEIKANRLWKARIHAFLASREEPDLRLGEAVQKGYFNLDHTALDKLKKLIELVESSIS